ncbi:hypothetical protein AX17_006121 [Amanita inopinata Kibby_2008]|nr:hypothetical protein AX17_006121 [Amanita inopinata Kibby_2008]
MSTRQRYEELRRKLLIAFDVGTTFSGISYSILDPGEVPEIHGVTRFPAQLHGSLKIPTVLHYDSHGFVQAVGAEAVQDGIEEIAVDNGWTRVEWFKLHLRPNPHDTAYIDEVISPLPGVLTVVDVLSDFLRYLYQCTKTYIEESHASGAMLWSSLEKQVHFVLTHPNGWGGFQQSQMKEAAIKAGLVATMEAAGNQISFVTEGEASLNYCVCNGISKEAFKDGRGVVIVDAGGGTVDISAYAASSKEGTYEEISAPQCHMKGSVFVTNNAEKFLKDHLRGSKYSEEGDVKIMTKEFDSKTKLFFRRSEDPQFIKFGGLRDNDVEKNIRSGQLKLSGTDMATFFAPSVQCIMQAILNMRDTAKKPINSVLLVGGFSASDWLFSQIKDTLQYLEITVSRPDGRLNKAVADGAISFYLDHFVNVRIARNTYGNACSYIFNPNNPEHALRSNQVYESPSKKRYIRGAFDVILSRDTQVSETTEFRRSYWYTASSRNNLHHIKNEILCYRGHVQNPRWMDVDRASYFKLCVVEADTTRLSHLLQPQHNVTGKKKKKKVNTFYELKYDIIMSFGLTELKAQIVWLENGREVRTPARIIYEPQSM